MQCDDCLNLLEQYVDGEATPREAEQVSAHLILCASCAREFEALTAEHEIYARYDRELEIPPATWQAIAERTAGDRVILNSPAPTAVWAWWSGIFAAPRLGFAFAGTMAVLLIALGFGLLYLRTREQSPNRQSIAQRDHTPAVESAKNVIGVVNPPNYVKQPAPLSGLGTTRVKLAKSNQPAHRKSTRSNGSDVLFTDAAYSDIEDRDTVSHLEQAQNMLLSIRNIKFSDDDEEVDVSYEKAESRRLLNENIVLRRDAEATGKFPAKSVLGSLEPFLIDIANLPDKAKPADVRQINDRVQRTEIVAELRSY